MSKDKNKQHFLQQLAIQEKRLAKKLAHQRIKLAWQVLPWQERPKQFSNHHIHRWNMHEEILNSITHGIGAMLGIIALITMIIHASHYGSARMIVSDIIFGVSLILAYASSMIYHLILYPPLKQILKVLDHSCIFILIAGTYTPFCLVTLQGAFGWTIFSIVWTCALVGVSLKLFFVDRYEILSTIVYLLMGWFAVTLSVQLIHHLPLPGIIWLIAGGLFYTGGVVFFILERIPFFHTIWHLFVLAGSASHFIAIWLYVY